MSLLCLLFGHEPFIYDQLPDGTKIRGCPRCGAYVRRETSDPRPTKKNTNPRFHVKPRRLRLVV